MGMILPLVDVFGFELGPPDLWPMGLGAGTPTRLERVGGESSFAFCWDAAQRLSQVEISWHAGQLAQRVLYHWRDDGALERVEYDQLEDHQDPDYAGPARVRSWTFEAGRPVQVETRWPAIGRTSATEAWEWSADARKLRITESSASGAILEVRRIDLDAAGKLLRLESERGGKGKVDRLLEVSWSDAGRLTSARETAGSALREVRYQWDARGRLLRQTRDARAAEWIYRYADEVQP